MRRRRTHVVELERCPGLINWPARLALRGRYTAELIHALTLAIRTTLASRDRHLRTARLRLANHEPGRRLEATRTRVVTVHERLGSALARRLEGLQGQLRDLTGRLDALSPLGVLGRGYAVCWHGDHHAIVRDTASVSVGDDLSITLHRGHLTATVTGKD